MYYQNKIGVKKRQIPYTNMQRFMRAQTKLRNPLIKNPYYQPAESIRRGWFDPPVVEDGRQVQQQERHTVNLNHHSMNSRRWNCIKWYVNLNLHFSFVPPAATPTIVFSIVYPCKDNKITLGTGELTRWK